MTEEFIYGVLTGVGIMILINLIFNGIMIYTTIKAFFNEDD